ncbi:aTPase associated with various cellular activities AAA_3 [Clostridium sp. CAG:505]|nr:aTPase associated with various cellular activities AAA_3 [Clostridium sp. CAG:505]
MEEEKIQQFASDFFRVEEEIGSVIIGQKELVRNVLTAMVAGGQRAAGRHARTWENTAGQSRGGRG